SASPDRGVPGGGRRCLSQTRAPSSGRSTTAICARQPASRRGSTRTTWAGSRTARSATCRWSCGASTAPSRRPTTSRTCTRRWAEWPGRRSPSRTTSTTTCATSPTTTTPMRARRGASSGTASDGHDRRRLLRGATCLVVEGALHPHVAVEAAVELERGAVARDRDRELRLLARSHLLVDAQRLGREGVRGGGLVLELDRDLLARLDLDERGLEVEVVGLEVNRGGRLRADVLGAL